MKRIEVKKLMADYIADEFKKLMLMEKIYHATEVEFRMKHYGNYSTSFNLSKYQFKANVFIAMNGSIMSQLSFRVFNDLNDQGKIMLLESKEVYTEEEVEWAKVRLREKFVEPLVDFIQPSYLSEIDLDGR